MDNGGGEQECFSIAATVFDSGQRRPTFDNGGGGLQQWAWLFDSGKGGW